MQNTSFNELLLAAGFWDMTKNIESEENEAAKNMSKISR